MKECPRCGAKHTVKCGFKILASGQKKQRRQCMNCGKYFMTELDPEPKYEVFK